MERIKSLFDCLLQKTKELNIETSYYIIRYMKKPDSKSLNKAIRLEGNMSSSFFEITCNSIAELSKREIAKYNCSINQDDKLVYVTSESIRKTNADIKLHIENPKAFSPENITDAQNGNYGICKINVYGEEWYFIMQQHKIAKRVKSGFLMFEGRTLKEVKSDIVLPLWFEVAMIIPPDLNGVFIANSKLFLSMYDYYDELKLLVKSKIDIIKNWEFLDSASLIEEKIGQKNVFINLSKVLNDANYLREISDAKPAQVKNRLIASGKFSKEDFTQNCRLILTTKNLEKVMKAIAKEFRYNFFTGKVVEE